MFIIDGYSSEYDKDNTLKDIKKLVLEKRNFFVEIIYDIKTPEDGIILYENLNPNNHINYNTYLPEKFYYFAKLKLFSQIEKYIIKDKIPEKYSQIFGENLSYFFEYLKKKDKMSFKEFVEEKKRSIKDDILKFCIDNCKLYLNEIINYIVEKKKFLYGEIIKYVPANYITINIEPEPIKENCGYDLKNEKCIKYYTLEFSFPLIQEIMKEISEDISYINMKNPQFLKAPAEAIGINFDIEMNKKIIKLFENDNFFEHSKKIKISVKDILEILEK